MLIKSLIISFLFNLILVNTISENLEPEVGDIVVTITDIRNTKGEMVISLFNIDEGFPDEISSTLKNKKISIQATTVEYIFEKVPYGEYAIAIMHDENGNGEMDTNFLGIPIEGVGVSNNALRKFGPPKYEDSKFIHDSKENLIEIKTHYY